VREPTRDLFEHLRSDSNSPDRLIETRYLDDIHPIDPHIASGGNQRAFETKTECLIETLRDALHPPDLTCETYFSECDQV
jgi:hypothetical protein